MHNKRILAIDREISNDSYETMLNNHDMIIGASGTGKTTGYVEPNLLRTNGSIIVADTKRMLYRKYAESLRKKGYSVNLLDMTSAESESSYNPLMYIRYDDKNNQYSEEDIMSIAYALIPDSARDAFWVNSARTLICCLISYVLEAFELSERNLVSVAEVFKAVGSQIVSAANDPYVRSIKFLEEWTALHPDSFAARKYLMFKPVLVSEKTWACIQQFVSTAIDCFDYTAARSILANNSFDICDLGRKKSVLFINVSDTDHTFDHILDIFYTQAFQVLCREADSKPNGRLDIPVRIVLDDFATNVKIKDFDKIISVIRSRDISVSIILQSITQLNSLYDAARSKTIINGCDHILYLGGNDVETATYIASRVFKTVENVLCMPNERAYLIERGKKGELVYKNIPHKLEAESIKGGEKM